MKSPKTFLDTWPDGGRKILTVRLLKALLAHYDDEDLVTICDGKTVSWVTEVHPVMKDAGGEKKQTIMFAERLAFKPQEGEV